MWFDSEDALKQEGFRGFKTIDSLLEGTHDISDEKGIYVMTYRGRAKPKFLEHGTGGWFGGKNPDYSLEIVHDRWVDDAIVIYAGKTDRPLKVRISEFLRFGIGRDIGHRGGRLVWQIRNREDLALCWKSTKGEPREPRDIERDMIAEFVVAHGKRPFVNVNP